MFSLDTRLLQRSLFIFIKDKELSLDSVIVGRLAVFISFSWLKLLSLSHDVIGRVNAIFSKTAILGYNKLLHFSRAPTSVSGIVVEHSFHSRTHEATRGVGSLYMTTRWVSLCQDLFRAQVNIETKDLPCHLSFPQVRNNSLAKVYESVLRQLSKCSTLNHVCTRSDRLQTFLTLYMSLKQSV